MLIKKNRAYLSSHFESFSQIRDHIADNTNLSTQLSLVYFDDQLPGKKLIDPVQLKTVYRKDLSNILNVDDLSLSIEKLYNFLFRPVESFKYNRLKVQLLTMFANCLEVSNFANFDAEINCQDFINHRFEWFELQKSNFYKVQYNNVQLGDKIFEDYLAKHTRFDATNLLLIRDEFINDKDMLEMIYTSLYLYLNYSDQDLHRAFGIHSDRPNTEFKDKLLDATLSAGRNIDRMVKNTKIVRDLIDQESIHNPNPVTRFLNNIRYFYHPDLNIFLNDLLSNMSPNAKAYVWNHFWEGSNELVSLNSSEDSIVKIFSIKSFLGKNERIEDRIASYVLMFKISQQENVHEIYKTSLVIDDKCLRDLNDILEEYTLDQGSLEDLKSSLSGLVNTGNEKINGIFRLVDQQLLIYRPDLSQEKESHVNKKRKRTDEVPVESKRHRIDGSSSSQEGFGLEECHNDDQASEVTNKRVLVIEHSDSSSDEEDDVLLTPVVNRTNNSISIRQEVPSIPEDISNPCLERSETELIHYTNDTSMSHSRNTTPVTTSLVPHLASSSSLQLSAQPQLSLFAKKSSMRIDQIKVKVIEKLDDNHPLVKLKDEEAFTHTINNIPYRCLVKVNMVTKHLEEIYNRAKGISSFSKKEVLEWFRVIFLVHFDHSNTVFSRFIALNINTCRDVFADKEHNINLDKIVTCAENPRSKDWNQLLEIMHTYYLNSPETRMSSSIVV